MTFHLFLLERGRHSTNVTSSPTTKVPFSSCTRNFLVCKNRFSYFGCFLVLSTFTVIVLFIATETTTPVNVRPVFSFCSFSFFLFASFINFIRLSCLQAVLKSVRFVSSSFLAY